MKRTKIYTQFILIASALFFGPVLSPAQTLEYLDVNNVKAGIGVGGNLFSTTMPTNIWDLLETPAGSGKKEIYTAALWMTGTDGGGNLHCAAQRYFDYGNDYFDGPVASVYNSQYNNYFNRVFKVSQTQLYHFSLLHFPAQASLVDSAIRYWPGKGNPSVLSDYGVNIDAPLAPFVDLNNNGVYEPLLGEYPDVPGDQNIFFVFNDIRGPHAESNGQAFGVEIRGMASSFLDYNYNLASYNSPLNNTVYVQYEIQNKSQVVYHNYNLGLFVDPDLGCFNDDFVGCDTDRAMMFVYNGTATDPDCAPEAGYGSTHVALGVQMLNRPMSVFGYFTSGGVVVGGGGASETAPTYNNYLTGFWGDGSPFQVGGSGYNSGGATTKFLFPGDPTDPHGWSEAQSNDIPGDRSMFSSTPPSTFSPGEIKHFDLAFTTAYNDGSDQFSIVDSLKNAADVVRRFYNEDIIPGQASGVRGLSGNNAAVSIYPNPCKNTVTIEATDNIKSLDLMDIQGRILLTQPVGAKTTTLSVSNLAKGVYLVNIQCVTEDVVRRIVVE